MGLHYCNSYCRFVPSLFSAILRFIYAGRRWMFWSDEGCTRRGLQMGRDELISAVLSAFDFWSDSGSTGEIFRERMLSYLHYYCAIFICHATPGERSFLDESSASGIGCAILQWCNLVHQLSEYKIRTIFDLRHLWSMLWGVTLTCKALHNFGSNLHVIVCRSSRKQPLQNTSWNILCKHARFCTFWACSGITKWIFREQIHQKLRSKNWTWTRDCIQNGTQAVLGGARQ